MLPASNDCSVLSLGQKLTPKYSSCRYLERAAEREALQARIQQCAGLGTWQALDVRGRELEEERQKVVQSALESGIGLCDSSPMYNEAERAWATL